MPEGCPSNIGPMVEVKIPAILMEQCKILVQMQYAEWEPLYHDTGESITVRNRRHSIIDVSNSTAESAASSNEVCKRIKNSTALLYFSQMEVEMIAELFNHKRLMGTPIIVFTGWQVTNQVCFMSTLRAILSILYIFHYVKNCIP